MKKSTGIILGVIAMIASLSIGLGIGYNLKDNNKGNVATEEENKVIEKDLSLDSTIVKALSKKVVGAYKNHQVTPLPYSDYFYKKDKTILNDEDISFKLSLAAARMNEYPSNVYNSDGNGGFSYIDEDEIKNAFYELFGKDSEYKRSTFYISSDNLCAGGYNWNSENNRYEAKLVNGCGGMTCGGVIAKLGYAKEIISATNDIIELYEYFAVLGCDDPSYYSDYNKTKLITNEKDEDLLFNKYKDKAGLFKYTFVKDSNDTYVFTSVEKVR